MSMVVTAPSDNLDFGAGVELWRSQPSTMRGCYIFSFWLAWWSTQNTFSSFEKRFSFDFSRACSLLTLPEPGRLLLYEADLQVFSPSPNLLSHRLPNGSYLCANMVTHCLQPWISWDGQNRWLTLQSIEMMVTKESFRQHFARMESHAVWAYGHIQEQWCANRVLGINPDSVLHLQRYTTTESNLEEIPTQLISF